MLIPNFWNKGTNPISTYELTNDKLIQIAKDGVWVCQNRKLNLEVKLNHRNKLLNLARETELLEKMSFPCKTFRNGVFLSDKTVKG